MSGVNNLLQTTKQNIRCVLLSAQRGLGLSKLLENYHDLIGRPLPYQELGYETAEEFLRTITDVVSLLRSSGNYVLKSADEKTAHMEKFMQKQKTDPENALLAYIERLVAMNPKRSLPVDSRSMSPSTRVIHNVPLSPAEISRPSPKPFRDILSELKAFPRPASHLPAVISTTAASFHTPVIPPPKLPLSALNEEVSNLVQYHGNVIDFSDLLQAFKKQYGRDLDYMSYDFESLADFLEQVPSLLLKIVNRKRRIVFLNPQITPPKPLESEPSIRRKTHFEYDAMPTPPALDTVMLMADICDKAPDDAVLPGEHQYTAEVLPTVCKGTYFPVYIAAIMNPTTVWIQLKGKKTSTSLSKLEHKLDALYHSKNGKKYTMLDQDVIHGAVGAGIWKGDGNWYRIKIFSIGTNFVRVTFVDHGHTGIVPKESLRYLKKEFMQLPTQAIKTRMAYIAPLRQEWSVEVRERLLELCLDEMLMAEIVDCPHYKDIVSVWLCDCNGEDDIHLNRLLIDEGYARDFDEKNATLSSAFNGSPNQISHLDIPTSVPAAQSAQAAEVTNAVKLICSTLAGIPDGNRVLNELMRNLTLASQHTENKQSSASNVSSLNHVPNTAPFYYGLNQEHVNASSQQNYPAQSTPTPNYNQQPVMSYLDSLTANNSSQSYSKNETMPTTTSFIKPPTRKCQ